MKKNNRRTRILITGAAGNLGTKLRHHLETRNQSELILLDRASAIDSGVLNADLSIIDRSWTRYFEGVDCVVHLAGEADAAATWQSQLTNNIVATRNLLEAAVAGGVFRVVLASSLQTMFGYEGKAQRIAPDMLTRPTNLYGVSKVIVEMLALDEARRHSLSIICLRLGLNYHGERRPRPGIDSIALQHRWLSNADFCQACEKAILADDQIESSVLNVTSCNKGSPWDLSDTERILGYRPQDGLTPSSPQLWRRVLGRLRRYRMAHRNQWFH